MYYSRRDSKFQECSKEELSLGIYTNNVSTSRRKQRKYALLEIIKRLLASCGVGMRVLDCMSKQLQNEVLVKQGAESAYFHGVMTCGSVWLCPVCSSRITEARRQELALALENTSFLPVMVTVTLQHDREDKLKDLLEALNDSLRKLKAGRWWKALQEKYSIKAHVSSLEFTYSHASGWHPHKHWLLFLDKKEADIDAEKLQNELVKRFRKLLERHGKYASSHYGIMVQVGDKHAGNYLQKWTVIEEVTKSNIKSGSGESYSPFQLAELGERWSSLAFLEYAKATFGKRQLIYSHGAREALQLGEAKTDIELAQENSKEDKVIIALSRDDWKRITNTGSQAEILFLAETGGAEAVRKFISGLAPPGAWRQHDRH